MAKGGVVGTVTSVVAAPITAPLAIAKAVAPGAVTSVENAVSKVPGVGTIVQGAEGFSNLAGDLISGDPRAKQDVTASAKAALTIGAAVGGGVAAGALTGSILDNKGLNPGSLLDAGAAFLGATDFAPSELLDAYGAINSSTKKAQSAPQSAPILSSKGTPYTGQVGAGQSGGMVILLMVGAAAIIMVARR